MNIFYRWTFGWLLVTGSTLSAFSQSNQETKLDEGLTNPEEVVAVFVRMEDQLFAKGGDYERFCAAQPATAKRLVLRDQVLSTLKRKAEASFDGLSEALDVLVEADDVRRVQRYWIVNGFACKATAKGCQALAELPGVGFVYRQRYAAQHRYSKPAQFEEDPELTALYEGLIEKSQGAAEGPYSAEGIELPWNLQKVGADKAWEEHGVSGKGVVVAILDDGMMTVPALLPSLWRNAGESLNGKDDDGNGLIDDVFGYNFEDNNPYSVTPSGHRHGTLCASVVAARPTTGDKPFAAGVAPRATIMPLVGNGRLKAYEYALEKGADVLSMSYTFEPVEMGQYRGLFRTAHEHMSAAGIVSVGGAGNYAERRPLGTQVGSPKDVPCVIAAAGVGPPGEISSFSSRGPVSWEGIRYFDGEGTGNVTPPKPDVTSCNADFPMWTLKAVWTGNKAKRADNVVRKDNEGYILAIGARGNSFAGPHAAGVIALMLEANPDLPVWQIQRLLQSTCEDMGEPGHDMAHGAGMLQAHKAVEAALAFR